MLQKPKVREPLLTPWQLSAKCEFAEFGAITPQEISKRHVRILTVLYLLQEESTDEEIEYAGVQAIQILIELIFNKKYTVIELLYWIDDLRKRGYIALLYPDEKVPEDRFFGLTSLGKDLCILVYEDKNGRKQFASEIFHVEITS